MNKASLRFFDIVKYFCYCQQPIIKTYKQLCFEKKSSYYYLNLCKLMERHNNK